MQKKKKKKDCCFQLFEASPQVLLWFFNIGVKRNLYISLGKFFSGMHATVISYSPEPFPSKSITAASFDLRSVSA